MTDQKIKKSKIYTQIDVVNRLRKLVDKMQTLTFVIVDLLS